MHKALTLTNDDASSAPEGGLHVRMRGSDRAPRQARRHVAGLRPELRGSLLSTTQLLVTELVTNSVRHAGASTIDLAVSVAQDRVRVEVGNPGLPFTPRSRAEALEPDPGWGLFLVDELSDAWGVNGDEGRQRVWFELNRS